MMLNYVLAFETIVILSSKYPSGVWNFREIHLILDLRDRRRNRDTASLPKSGK